MTFCVQFKYNYPGKTMSLLLFMNYKKEGDVQFSLLNHSVIFPNDILAIDMAIKNGKCSTLVLQPKICVKKLWFYAWILLPCTPSVTF